MTPQGCGQASPFGNESGIGECDELAREFLKSFEVVLVSQAHEASCPWPDTADVCYALKFMACFSSGILRWGGWGLNPVTRAQ
jgi:hypothetical protein